MSDFYDLIRVRADVAEAFGPTSVEVQLLDQLVKDASFLEEAYLAPHKLVEKLAFEVGACLDALIRLSEPRFAVLRMRYGIIEAADTDELTPLNDFEVLHVLREGTLKHPKTGAEVDFNGIAVYFEFSDFAREWLRLDAADVIWRRSLKRRAARVRAAMTGPEDPPTPETEEDS